MKRRRNRRIKIFPVVVATILVLSLVLNVILLTVSGGDNKEGKVNLSSGVIVKNEEDKYSEIMDNEQQYPEKLIDLLERNIETLDFVYNYPEKKDVEPANSVGKVSKGTIPKLLQWDERWGYADYGDNIIAINGCGPTALSMVVVGLTGDDSITPYRIAKYAEENGYYVEETGTAWSLMYEGCENFGIRGNELPLDESIIFSELESGNPIICSMGPGDFTDVGHFIVLTGVEDGKIKVNDPNSRIRSKLWEYENLEGQIRNLWSFEKE